jgi:hypothetical protein
MARGNPGRIWEVKETGKLAFSYHKEQTSEMAKLNKVLVYMTEVTQLSLFKDLPPVEQCGHVLKDVGKLKMIGFMD